MCPTFRALRAESASPRAKANLLRQVAAGPVDPKLWGTEEFKENADLCIHCNLCPTECPSGVDVSSLMLEAKAAYVENHGLPPADWVALAGRALVAARQPAADPLRTPCWRAGPPAG